MILRRTNARLVRWAGPLVGSLLLSGCDAMPGASRDLTDFNRDIHSALPAASGLRPCAEPALQPVGEASQVVAASHPAPLAVERMPAVARPFPIVASESPLAGSLPREQAGAIEHGRQGRPAESGPALMAANGSAEAPGAEFGPPPLPGLSDDEARALNAKTIARPVVRSKRVARAADKPGEGARPPWPPTAPTIPQLEQPAPPPLRRDPAIAPPPSAPLLLPRPPKRSPEQAAVARQAERQVRRGYALAARGALYSARSQFIQALRTIAQSLDVQEGGRRHTEALGAGLTALEEAEDFVPRGSNVEADLDVGVMVRGHCTPVLKDAPAAELIAVIAQQHYYTYAQEQLTLAAGREEAGSMALFGLGKAYGTLATQQSPQTVAPEPKAMVFHQAALTVDGGNYLAANELAVLVARYGRYDKARELLQHSVTLAPQSAIWRNLAVVHRRLGETELAVSAEKQAAEAARREAVAAAQPSAAAPGDLQWVDPATFAASTKPVTDLQRTASDRQQDVKGQPAAEEAKGLLPWLPRASRQAPAEVRR
jgi:tetratricopeptide (TPR) repeat protein